MAYIITFKDRAWSPLAFLKGQSGLKPSSHEQVLFFKFFCLRVWRNMTSFSSATSRYIPVYFWTRSLAKENLSCAKLACVACQGKYEIVIAKSHISSKIWCLCSFVSSPSQEVFFWGGFGIGTMYVVYVNEFKDNFFCQAGEQIRDNLSRQKKNVNPFTHANILFKGDFSKIKLLIRSHGQTKFDKEIFLV